MTQKTMINRTGFIRIGKKGIFRKKIYGIFNIDKSRIEFISLGGYLDIDFKIDDIQLIHPPVRNKIEIILKNGQIYTFSCWSKSCYNGMTVGTTYSAIPYIVAEQKGKTEGLFKYIKNRMKNNG